MRLGKMGAAVLAGVSLFFASMSWALAQSPEDSSAGATGDAASTEGGSSGAALDQYISVDIGAQAVSTALLELSKQARVQILFAGGSLDAFETSGLSGEMSLDSALAALLKGTAATFRSSGPGIVSIEVPEASEVTESLPVIEIPEPAPQPIPAQADEEEGPQRLDEVIVTSTKREKSLRDIPQTISSFNGEDLEARGQVSLADYLEKSPGVVMNTLSPGLLRINIRGVGVETASLSGNPSPTGIFINDTAFTDPYLAGVQPDLSAFDLSSVELLKGPQGTLFGGAALAGAVRFILQEPVLGETQVKGFTQLVNPHGGSTAVTNGVMLNAPLYQDKLAVRLGYVARKYPGVTDDVRNPREDNVDSGEGEQIRGLLTWQPLDELSIKIVHLSQDYFTPNASTLAQDRENRETNTRILPQPVSNDFALDTLTFEYQFETMKAVSLTSRTKKNLYIFADGTSSLIGIPPPGYPQSLAAFQTITDNSDATAQEFRLQSTGGGNFEWLVGAYLYDYSVFFDLFIDTVAQQTLQGNGSLIAQLLNGLSINAESLYQETSLFYAVSRAKANERALFFDLGYTLWNDLELSAGARLYQTETNGGFYGTGVVTRTQNNGRTVDASEDSIKERGINPKVSALYHATDNLSFFGQASRGFRFGGLNSVPSTATNGVPRNYKSDSLWNYELGARSNWLDNTLHLDLTAFYIRYKDPQIKQATDTAVFSLSYTDNVAGAVSRGLEFSSRWLTPISGLSLELDAGLTDAHTTAEFETSDGIIIPSGTQMPGSAKTSYSGTIAYLRPLGLVLLGTTLDYTYVGKGFSDLGEDPQRAINDFGTLNAGITLASDAWALRPQLALSVSNILDVTAAKGAGRVEPISQLPGYETYLLNQPRTFTARLSLSF